MAKNKKEYWNTEDEKRFIRMLGCNRWRQSSAPRNELLISYIKSARKRTKFDMIQNKYLKMVPAIDIADCIMYAQKSLEVEFGIKDI